jgi:hypothetical protein
VKKSLIITFLLFISIAVNAKNYYVKNRGNNSNTGLSDAQAWATITKVNTSSFSPGDTIFFNKGDTWRERLTVPSSGNGGANIVFSSYGTGSAPKILGSTEVTAWTNDTGNIWYSDNTLSDPYALQFDGNIYFKEKDGDISWGRVKKSTKGALAIEYDWIWISNHIYIYSPTDPNSRYSGVEVAQRKEVINLNNKNFLTIDGLEVAYSGFTGINDQWPATNLIGLTIKNCHVHHMGTKEVGYGIEVWHSSTFIQNNTIHDSGRRNISLNIYAGDVQLHDVIVEGNTLYDAYHTTGVDINTSGAGTYNNIIIRKNLMYHTNQGVIDGVENFTTQMIFVSSESTGTLSNIYIYNNIFKNTKGIAINVGQEPNRILSSYIYNNTFYGVDPNLVSPYMSFIFLHAGSNSVIKNNIFYNNINPAVNSTFSCLNVASDAGTVTSDYNLFYVLSATRLLNWKGTSYSKSQLATYKSVKAQDTHSPNPANPLFVSSSDYHLQSGSPAIDAGIGVGLTTDYDGNTYHNPPSIGAYEYNSAAIPVYQSSVIENATPSILEMTYNIPLSNIIPAASSFLVNVNSVARTVNTVAISGNVVKLTLKSPVVYGNIVTISYTKPSTNSLQTGSGETAASINNQPVIINCINDPPTVVITSPINNSSFIASANITLTAKDDSISLIEFYNGITKLGSTSTTPYSFTWNNVPTGTYSLTVVATDNLNVKTISSVITIFVNNETNPVNQPPVVTITNPSKGNKYENLSTITIEAIASDPDGTISKVELYNGINKLVELTSPPYSFTWKAVEAGSYLITAIATDNLNATTTSSPVEFVVGSNIKYDAHSEIINLYPNPNDGHFSIEFINPLQNEISEVVITDLAGKHVYNGPVSKEEIIKQIDLSYIKSGIYILMIIYKRIIVTKKFIKN